MAKVTELDIQYMALCIADFESNKTAKNWDRMIHAISTRGKVSRKVAIFRCERKYGRMFGGVL